MRFAPILLLLSVAYFDVQVVKEIDVRNVQPELREREPRAGTVRSLGIGPGTSSGLLTSRAPLGISVSQRVSNRRDSSLILQIENVSKIDVDIPCGTQPRDVEKLGAYSYRVLTIRIVPVRNPNSSAAQSAPIILYGAPYAPSTLVRLRPGQSVLIEGSIDSSLGGAALVRAVLTYSEASFHDTDGVPTEDVTESFRVESEAVALSPPKEQRKP
jgi:hypothetical protein